MLKTQERKRQEIDPESALKILQTGGNLSKVIKGFEPRDQQQK